MKLQQLSIFLENKPGQVKKACDLLARSGINIRTLSLAETKQYGILRLIVHEWERAKKVLEEGGFSTKTTPVLAVQVADQPGGLAAILDPVEKAGINIEYMYAFTFGREDKAVLIFRFDDPERAQAVLQEAGIEVLKGVDLLSD
jgi:hypothetical protein